MNEKPYVLKLSVFDDDNLPFFLRGNINTTLIKKLDREVSERMKVIIKLSKEHVNKSKRMLESTVKSTNETEKENIQQSKLDSLNLRYENFLNNNLKIEAEIDAKSKLIKESENKDNFDARKAELKDRLAVCEKDWIIQKETIKRIHLTNLYECKMFEKFLNCKFKVTNPLEVEVEFHPGYHIKLKFIGDKWTLLEIVPSTFFKEKYIKKFEETKNLPFLLSSLQYRMESVCSAS